MPNYHPKPFPKTGAAANPNGRPKSEWTWAGLIKEAMEETSKKTGKDVKHYVAQALMKKALEGDVTAIKEIGNRIDGMPKQTTDIHVKELPKPLLSSLDQETDVSHNNGLTETEDTE